MEIDGFKVIEIKAKPKIQLSPSVDVTPNFRKEMNDWLAASFGYQELVETDKPIVNKQDKIIFVNSEMYYGLKREQAAQRVVYGL